MGAARLTAVGARLRAQVTPPRVVLLLVVLAMVIAGWHDYPCANGHPAPDVVWSRACYTDLLPLYSGRGLSDGLWPYLGHDVEYPVLIGAMMALVGLPVHWLAVRDLLTPLAQLLGFETVDEGVVFFWGTAAVLAMLAILITVMMLRLRADRPWDVALWAVAPGLAAMAFLNWDLLASAATVGGLLAWSRRRPGWAGILLGLGAAAKVYPALLLWPLVLLCLLPARGRPGPRQRRGRVVLRLLAGAAGAWLVVNLPVMLATPRGWLWPYTFARERWIDWGSLWYGLDHLAADWSPLRALRPAWAEVSTLNLSSTAAFALGCVGIAVLVRYAPEPPRVSSLAFLVVAAFVLSNKVWSPQYVLWLIPLAVLAVPRWPLILSWQVVEIAYLMDVMRTIFAGGGEAALLLMTVVRWVVLAALCAVVVADVLRPERDLVRRADGSDPDAGVLDSPATPRVIKETCPADAGPSLYPSPP